jgi:uncharacterized membrane protein
VAARSVVSVGNEDPAPEALRSHASVQIKMRIQENAKNQEQELKQTENLSIHTGTCSDSNPKQFYPFHTLSMDNHPFQSCDRLVN